jgi:hypothetical protein
MRRMREAVLPLAAGDEHLPKTVREFREKYKGVSRILDKPGRVRETHHNSAVGRVDVQPGRVRETHHNSAVGAQMVRRCVSRTLAAEARARDA